MSDGILSGLRVLSDDAGTPGRIYNDALADVRWRLRNPTDEQVDAIGEALLMTDSLWAPQPDLTARRDIVRFVLAAAAGGDSE